MQQALSFHARRVIKTGLAIAAGLIFALTFRNVLAELAILLLGASAIAFFLEPLSAFFERKLSRKHAALAAISGVLIAMLLAVWLLLPALVRQFSQLAIILPDSLESMRAIIAGIADRFRARFPGVDLPIPSLPDTLLPGLASATFSAAGAFAGFFYRLSMMIVLSYFLLCDRSRLMIRLELLIPSNMRKTAVCMGNAVCRELRLYLRGQAMISVAVGALSALGLWLIGVSSPLALGGLVGVLNMIPYFGPVLGGVPAVITALGQGWYTALAAAAVLWLVQQMDSTFISPRILGGISGLSPGVVLVSIFAGSHLAGVAGMLFALPLVMSIRTVFRVFVQRHENV